MLVPMAPACHHKMLHNMRKEQDKAAMKKKTKMKGGGGDEDDDDDDDKGDMKSRRSTVKTANTGFVCCPGVVPFLWRLLLWRFTH